jgi:uncharacterized phage-associated protein
MAKEIELHNIGWYAAWFINRGIEEANNTKNSALKELCFMDYEKLHRLLYYTLGITYAEHYINLLGMDESICALECGPMISSLGWVVANFDYGPIKERVENKGLEQIPNQLVVIMESVYKELGKKKRRELMRHCKKSLFWTRYGFAEADPRIIFELNVSKIGRYFRKLKEYGHSYFLVDITLHEREEVIMLELSWLKRKPGFRPLLSMPGLNKKAKTLSELLLLPGYTNITAPGIQAYKKKIIAVKKQLEEIADGETLAALTDENYQATIQPCSDWYRRSGHEEYVEFAESRARNNIDALLAESA